MKSLCRILFCVMCVLPAVAGAAPVATTAGSNLTAYNPNTMGSVNNNQWNSLMNNRTGTANGPVADFGNCNALILRCATPKCAAGGCTSMDVTIPIVNGCVMDNATCKQYGDDLVQSIAAQIVANSNARAAQAAQNAAASAAAQSSQQMAQMQQEMNMQMQQMQAQMQQQNAETVAQLQAALAEQKQMAAAAQQQVADAQAAQVAQAAQSATSESGLTAAQEQAAARGVDADLLVREQVTGQIMSKLENAETALKALEATMKDVFTYAGCDSRGDNCAGPKRVKVFKQKAMDFFDPYNDVLDELYDALITAQAVGVDITDIYMMLNGSCNVWGEYLCAGMAETKIDTNTKQFYYIWPEYTTTECPVDGGKSKAAGRAIGGRECYAKQVIPPEDLRGCVLQRTLSSGEEVQRSWLETQSGDNMIRVGCASSALENSAFFRNRKKQASIDIETLERIIEQDAPAVFGRVYGGEITTPEKDGIKYCAVSGEGMQELQKAVSLKKLPDDVCVNENFLNKERDKIYVPETSNDSGAALATVKRNCNGVNSDLCRCVNSGGYWTGMDCFCRASDGLVARNKVCVFDVEAAFGVKSNNYLDSIGGGSGVSFQNPKEMFCSTWGGEWRNNKCDCSKASNPAGCMNSQIDKELSL